MLWRGRGGVEARVTGVTGALTASLRALEWREEEGVGFESREGKIEEKTGLGLRTCDYIRGGGMVFDIWIIGYSCFGRRVVSTRENSREKIVGSIASASNKRV